MKKLDYKQLANVLLDSICETIGIVDAVQILISQGFTNDEILFLRFDIETINKAQEIVNGLGE